MWALRRKWNYVARNHSGYDFSYDRKCYRREATNDFHFAKIFIRHVQNVRAACTGRTKNMQSIKVNARTNLKSFSKFIAENWVKIIYTRPNAVRLKPTSIMSYCITAAVAIEVYIMWVSLFVSLKASKCAQFSLVSASYFWAKMDDQQKFSSPENSHCLSIALSMLFVANNSRLARSM